MKVVYVVLPVLALLQSLITLVQAQCTQPQLEDGLTLSDGFISTENFPDGQTVTFVCMSGYRTVSPSASKTATCEGNKWSSLELKCEKKPCGALPDFQNGKYTQTGILFGDTANAVCNTGYVLAGRSPQRTCRADGWSGREPECEAVQCDPPPTIKNGEFEPLKDNYQYSDAVEYSCKRGFSIIGSSTLHCSASGSFTPDPPTCFEGCPRPTIDNAIRVEGLSPSASGLYELNSFLKYKCNTGLKMIGEATIVCKGSGWDPAPPNCVQPESCSKPEFKGHVTIRDPVSPSTTFPHGSTLGFKCVEGHEPVQSTVSDSVTCDDGQWSGLLLTCRAIPPLKTTTTSRILPTDKAIPPPPKTTTSSSNRPDDDESPKTSNEPDKIGIGWIVAIVGVLVGLLLVVGIYIYKKKRSKREYSQKVPTRTEEREL